MINVLVSLNHVDASYQLNYNCLTKYRKAMTDPRDTMETDQRIPLHAPCPIMWKRIKGTGLLNVDGKIVFQRYGLHVRGSQWPPPMQQRQEQRREREDELPIN